MASVSILGSIEEIDRTACVNSLLMIETFVSGGEESKDRSIFSMPQAVRLEYNLLITKEIIDHITSPESLLAPWA